ncbi:MAG: pteridine-dependent deoxygenase [Aquimonas sp.]|nr:pteridine-dependent deoxygenase [Aquimonas sp.]
MTAPQPLAPTSAPLAVRHAHASDPAVLLGPHTLALFGFGDRAPRQLPDPRYVWLPLEPLLGGPCFEAWECDGRVEPFAAAAAGLPRGARCGGLEFAQLDCTQEDAGSAAETAYARLQAHRLGGGHPHLLKVWNFLDGLLEGTGDNERYRRFCVGRAAALPLPESDLPAATAIGYRNGDRGLRMHWLAATQPGEPVENPRQVPAYRYPRSYGPQAPGFARAMLAPAGSALPLLISGTAAVVGHASAHPGRAAEQLREIRQNLDSLLQAAAERRPHLPALLGAASPLRLYLREPAQAAMLAQLLDELLPSAVPRILLQGDICRAELAVEIDGFHG